VDSGAGQSSYLSLAICITKNKIFLRLEGRWLEVLCDLEDDISRFLYLYFFLIHVGNALAGEVK
jgi:hypothetical protein